MTSDTATASDAAAHPVEVMASIESTTTGERLVIADVTRDDAWISMRRSDRTSLPDWA